MKRQRLILEAVAHANWQELWLAEKGLPGVTISVPDGDPLLLILHAPSKALHLFARAPALLDEPRINSQELVVTIETMIDGMVAEAIELPDDSVWLAEHERQHAAA